MNTDDNTISTSPSFKDFNSLAQQNRELIRATASSFEITHKEIDKLLEFIDLAVATGRHLDDVGERSSAQTIIEKWVGRLASTGNWRSDTYPSLAIFEAKPNDASVANTSEEQRSLDRQNNREIISLNLTAKNWIKSSEAKEYLLRGHELERAKEISSKVKFDSNVKRLISRSVKEELLRRSRRHRFYARLAEIFLFQIILVSACIIVFVFREEIQVSIYRWTFRGEVQVLTSENDQNLTFSEFASKFQRDGQNPLETPLFKNQTLNKLTFTDQRIDIRVNFDGGELVKPQFQSIRGGHNFIFLNTALTDSRFTNAELGQVDFSGCKIQSTKEIGFLPSEVSRCSDLKLRMPDETDSLPQYSSFRNVSAEGANFASCSSISNTDFSFASLTDADFSNIPEIQNSVFAQAQLKNADFSGSKISRSPFCNADLTNANFLGASHDQNFLDTTAWWLAKWDEKVVLDLLQKYPTDAYRNTDFYKSKTSAMELKARELTEELLVTRKNNIGPQELNTVKNRVASGYNNLAWHYAIHGDVKQEAALEYALKAIPLSEDSNVICDTIAYILMQNGYVETASNLYKQMIVVENDRAVYKPKMISVKTKEVWPVPSDVLYRYKRALQATKKLSDAHPISSILKELPYTPTHELVLLKNLKQVKGAPKLPDKLNCAAEFGNIAPEDSP